MQKKLSSELLHAKQKKTYKELNKLLRGRISRGRAQRGICTVEDGRKAERSSAPYAEASLPRFARTCLVPPSTTLDGYNAYYYLLHVHHKSMLHVNISQRSGTCSLHVNVEDWKRFSSLPYYPTFHTFTIPSPLLP